MLVQWFVQRISEELTGFQQRQYSMRLPHPLIAGTYLYGV
jgi:hypothetical protein